jgi:hypothetical protein
MMSTPTKHYTPAHIGNLKNNPYYAEWKEALFKNYTKMLSSGTWSAPVLCSLVPPTKTILPPRVTFKVKTTDINNTYELYCRTCANGANMKENIDFTNSYSSVGSIESIHLLPSLVASNHWTLNVLDVSNAFQTSIIFDPNERTYLSLPPFYLEWFKAQWLDYKLPSENIKDLVLQCLRAIQGTKDAGNRWYALLCETLLNLGLQRPSLMVSSHGTTMMNLVF